MFAEPWEGGGHYAYEDLQITYGPLEHMSRDTVRLDGIRTAISSVLRGPQVVAVLQVFEQGRVYG